LQERAIGVELNGEQVGRIENRRLLAKFWRMRFFSVKE